MDLPDSPTILFSSSSSDHRLIISSHLISSLTDFCPERDFADGVESESDKEGEEMRRDEKRGEEKRGERRDKGKKKEERDDSIPSPEEETLQVNRLIPQRRLIQDADQLLCVTVEDVKHVVPEGLAAVEAEGRGEKRR